MEPHARLVLSVAVLAFAMTQAVPSEAKPRHCFTKTEEAAEQQIRLGLRLREGARFCAEAPWNIATIQPWADFDQKYGARLAMQTALRRKAFEREFDKNAQDRLSMWNGRIVMLYRQYPLSMEYCSSIRDMLGDFNKKTWTAFTKQAAKGKDEVKLDYKTCP